MTGEEAGQGADRAACVAHEESLERRQPVDRRQAEIAGQGDRSTIGDKQPV